MLIIVSGLIGAGKTTVCKILADKLGGVTFGTNDIRNQVLNNPTHSKKEIANVYDLFFQRAEDLIVQKNIVILDATFYREKHRNIAKNLAQKYGVKFYIYKVGGLSDLEHKNRIEKRGEYEGKTNYQEYLKHKLMFEKIKNDIIFIDNSGTIEDLEKNVVSIITTL